MAKREGYRPKHASEDRPGGGTIPKVDPDAPGRPGTKGPTSTRRRGPQHGSPETKRRATGAALASARKRKLGDIAEEARSYATRAAIARTEGKPSVTGRAAAGAAAGTAAGAALGGLPGAAAGAVLGGAGGALGGAKAKKAYKLAMHSNLGARRVIVAEFMICMVVIGFSPLTDRKKEELPTTFMRRMTALMALFFILGMMSAGGRAMARFAAGFGGLVTVALVVSNRDLFMKIGSLMGSTTAQGKAVGKAKKPPVEAPTGEPGEVVS